MTILFSPIKFASSGVRESGFAPIALLPTSPVDYRIYIILAVWLISVATGILYLIQYSYATRSLANQFAKPWPSQSTINHQPGIKHLLVFLHPQCSCSHATINQLQAVLHDVPPSSVQVTAIFFKPELQSDQWVRSGLWNSTGSVPDVRRLVDLDGRETRRFGVVTSGHIVFFDAHGKRRYDGGITSARAHEGDNIGSSALRSLLNNRPTRHCGSPVFGCPIHEETSTP